MTASYEQRVVIWLHHRLIEQEPFIWTKGEQITVEEVRLEQGKPEGDELMILFRHPQRPHCLFSSSSPQA